MCDFGWIRVARGTTPSPRSIIIFTWNSHAHPFYSVNSNTIVSTDVFSPVCIKISLINYCFERCIKLFVHFVRAIIIVLTANLKRIYVPIDEKKCAHHKMKLIAKIMDIEACNAFWELPSKLNLDVSREFECRLYVHRHPETIHIWNQHTKPLSNIIFCARFHVSAHPRPMFFSFIVEN